MYVIYKAIKEQNIYLRNNIPQGSNLEPFISYINNLSLYIVSLFMI